MEARERLILFFQAAGIKIEVATMEHIIINNPNIIIKRKDFKPLAAALHAGLNQLINKHIN